ncbi:MAG: hypothetical protein ACI4QM_02985 [Alphaproteobacteria bacterium]
MPLRNNFWGLAFGLWAVSMPAVAVDVNDPAYLAEGASAPVAVADFSARVQIDTLPDISLDTIGTHHLYPADLWDGSDQAVLVDLLKRAVRSDLSVGERRTLVNMLLTNTSGHSGLAPNIRIKALLSLGAFDKVQALIELIPPHRRTVQIWQGLFDALFLSGQVKKACALAEKTPQLRQTAEQMRLACAVATGDKIKAELIFATHLDTGDLDALSEVLGDNLLRGAQRDVPQGADLLMRHIHLAAALGDKMAWDKVSASRPIKKALSALPTLPIGRRIAYAETTAVPPEQLARLYQTVSVQTPDDGHGIHRAFLYQKMRAEQNPQALAQVLRDFAVSARADGLFTALAGVLMEPLSRLTPSQDTVAAAFDGVQVYALADNAAAAYSWFKVLEAARDNTFQNQAVLLTPLMNKAGAGIPMRSDALLVACAQKPSSVCTAFLARAPDYFSVKNADLVLKSGQGVSYAYPPIAGGTLSRLIQDKKTGEAWLRGVLAIHTSDTFEPALVKAFETMRPRSLSKDIITEQYIYQ